MSMPEDAVRQEIFGSLVSKPRSRLAGIALLLAIASLLTAVASGFGHQFGIWSYQTGLVILMSAAGAAVASVALAVVGAYQARPRGTHRGRRMAVMALLIGAVTAAVPLSWTWVAYHLPPIHDITTDTENPPQFVAILPLRYRASDPVEYGGPQVAALQHEAYPDIQPLQVPLPPAQVFEAALATARDQDWIIVATDPANGRIEATDSTFWFGFIDDVVVRLTPGADGDTRVDVRSVSRVGVGDAGANARRVRNFLFDLADRLGKAGMLKGRG
jgi:uncharacterized protein (DUF1499 family)/NADH:ubiquinone oxidoreductase subunit K